MAFLRKGYIVTANCRKKGRKTYIGLKDAKSAFLVNYEGTIGLGIQSKVYIGKKYKGMKVRLKVELMSKEYFWENRRLTSREWINLVGEDEYKKLVKMFEEINEEEQE